MKRPDFRKTVSSRVRAGRTYLTPGHVRIAPRPRQISAWSRSDARADNTAASDHSPADSGSLRPAKSTWQWGQAGGNSILGSNRTRPPQCGHAPRRISRAASKARLASRAAKATSSNIGAENALPITHAPTAINMVATQRYTTRLRQRRRQRTCAGVKQGSDSMISGPDRKRAAYRLAGRRENSGRASRLRDPSCRIPNAAVDEPSTD